MQIIIRTHGSHIRSNGEFFTIITESKVSEFPRDKVSSLIISHNASISTDAIKMAIDSNIDMVFIDEIGDPYARICHPHLEDTTIVRRKQLEYAQKERGLYLALSWVKRKFDQQTEFLGRQMKEQPSISEALREYREKLSYLGTRLDSLNGGSIVESRETIIGTKGIARMVYFEALFIILLKEQVPGQNSPVQEQCSSFLHCAYEILSSKVEKACIITGLDPCIGFIHHPDNSHKKSLVLDLMENYYIWADESVMNMFASHMINDTHFDQFSDGIYPNKRGRAVLSQEINAFLEQSVSYEGKNMTREDIIECDCKSIVARDLLTENEEEQLYSLPSSYV